MIKLGPDPVFPLLASALSVIGTGTKCRRKAYSPEPRPLDWWFDRHCSFTRLTITTSSLVVLRLRSQLTRIRERYYNLTRQHSVLRSTVSVTARLSHSCENSMLLFSEVRIIFTRRGYLLIYTCIPAGGVGKSALTVRFVRDVFIENYDPTIEGVYSDCKNHICS
jgi:hypothetical protein